jgi:hypothetical protein
MEPPGVKGGLVGRGPDGGESRGGGGWVGGGGVVQKV